MTPPDPAAAYRAAGVDLDASDETMARIKAAVTASYTPQVLSGVGAFGGLFDAGTLKTIGRARAGRLDRRRGNQNQGRRRSGPLRHARATIWSTTASTTSWCRARGPCSF